MKIYLFDVDHTLEVSEGPVSLESVRELLYLSREDVVLGLCGNWAVALPRIDDWSVIFSFIGPMTMQKYEFMNQIKTYAPPFDDYIMVGNDGDDQARWPNGASADRMAAHIAGWRFISEDEFAAGER